MSAVFQEVFPVSGVDGDANPVGMIVPAGGSNIVRLAGGKGLQLQAPRTLKIEEVPPPSLPVLLTLLLLPISVALLTLKRVGIIGPAAPDDTRYIRISASTPSARAPAQVQAVRAGSSKPEAVLKVAVLKRRKVRVSIRPVQVRSPQGGLVFHSKKPFDPKAMVEQMNAIWTPQANVAFELVSSDPAQILDRAEIASILDLKMSKDATLPSMVVLQRFVDVFTRLKDKNAELTMFLVESAGDLRDPRVLYSHAKVVNGITDPALGVSLISDARTSHRELMAHEAGHFIGSHTGRDGNFMSFPDKGGMRDLMQDGGSEIARVRYQDVIEHFNRP
ncbi:hypothetical protein [Bradyrhizobium sp.]|uniref:hypothetical protein n=1 Tax=Bradyrhizobium sp. TaxID=376 RepID=UPI001EBE3BBD|nr:hypothetical protein [Bradyrhizobium sp.]MBV9985493.1 hypothetical protein [Bradyrhizobium sp.]